MTEKKEKPAPGELSGDGLGDATEQASPVGTAEVESEGMQDGASTDALAEALASLEQAKAEIAELNSRLLRAHADFENFRRRAQKEKEDLALYANQKLLLSFLPVLDNLERALGSAPTPGDEKLRQGVELTARSFRETLSREGLTAIEAVGQRFDPNLHEAVATVPSEEYEDDTVVAEFQKGYKLGDRVIRPSMVQVSKRN